MLPCSLDECAVHNGPRNLKTIRKLPAGSPGSVKSPRLLNLFFVKYGAMLLASACCSPLHCFIRHVVRRGAEKQMRGITTWRIVATVQHEFIFRYGAVCQFVSNAMRSGLLALPVESPVVARRTSRRPGPALFGFLYVRPKLIRGRILRFPIAPLRAVQSRSLFKARYKDKEFFLTFPTDAWYFLGSQCVDLSMQGLSLVRPGYCFNSGSGRPILA
jgi:hypothetical protein